MSGSGFKGSPGLQETPLAVGRNHFGDLDSGADPSRLGQGVGFRACRVQGLKLCEEGSSGLRAFRVWGVGFKGLRRLEWGRPHSATGFGV